MKITLNEFVKNLAAFAVSLGKYKDRQPPPITLSMIATELESDLMKLRSRFAKATIKGYGIKASWPFISRR